MQMDYQNTNPAELDRNVLRGILAAPLGVLERWAVVPDPGWLLVLVASVPCTMLLKHLSSSAKAHMSV